MRGQGHLWNTETYPTRLCEMLAMDFHLDITRAYKEAHSVSDIGLDGSYGHCQKCKDTDGEGGDTELHQCCGCPLAFHIACIPERARREESGAFLCDLCASVGWQMLQPESEHLSTM